MPHPLELCGVLDRVELQIGLHSDGRKAWMGWDISSLNIAAPSDELKWTDRLLDIAASSTKLSQSRGGAIREITSPHPNDAASSEGLRRAMVDLYWWRSAARGQRNSSGRVRLGAMEELEETKPSTLEQCGLMGWAS